MKLVSGVLVLGGLACAVRSGASVQTSGERIKQDDNGKTCEEVVQELGVQGTDYVKMLDDLRRDVMKLKRDMHGLRASEAALAFENDELYKILAASKNVTLKIYLVISQPFEVTTGFINRIITGELYFPDSYKVDNLKQIGSTKYEFSALTYKKKVQIISKSRVIKRHSAWAFNDVDEIIAHDTT